MKGGAHVKANNLVCLLTVPCNAVDSVCVHLMAAGRVIGFTPRLRLDAAAHLASSGLITVDADTGICSCQALADVLKVVHFRPKEGFCTCYDRTLHGTCCHLQAAPLLAAFVGVELPAAAHHVAGDSETVSAAHAGAGRARRVWHAHTLNAAADLSALSHHPCQPPPTPTLQRIDISRHRKFQQASSEPLGSDSGRAELSTIWGVRATNATSIRQMQSNADPAVAQLRQDLTGIEFIAINLPDGKEREELRQAVHDLRSKAESLGVSAKLPLTATRAGKVARRRNGRREEQRVVTALQPSRQQNRKRAPLAQQQQAEQQQPGQQHAAGGTAAGRAEAGDPFPTLGKKGKPTNKVSE